MVLSRRNLAVFIGRMQPPHLAHIRIIQQGLDKANNVAVVLGSHRAAPSIRNPWNDQQRVEMLKRCFSYEDQQRIKFVFVRDYPYDDTRWIAEVQHKVEEPFHNWHFDKLVVKNKPLLVGHAKDETSYYLEYFPQWDFQDIDPMYKGYSATQIREEYFSEGPKPSNSWTDFHWSTSVHEGVRDWLEEFRNTSEFALLYEQWQFVKKYKESWAQAPYPPVFVTTDAVVIKSGHVLLVRRRFNPGKNLWALPGGHLEQSERVQDCALRELKEETRIGLPKKILSTFIKDSYIFDHPHRSTRGRTITHAYYFKLPDGGRMPEVRADSDAKVVRWVPLSDLRLIEESFFEDHIHIIEHFTTT